MKYLLNMNHFQRHVRIKVQNYKINLQIIFKYILTLNETLRKVNLPLTASEELIDDPPGDFSGAERLLPKIEALL